MPDDDATESVTTHSSRLQPSIIHMPQLQPLRVMNNHFVMRLQRMCEVWTESLSQVSMLSTRPVGSTKYLDLDLSTNCLLSVTLTEIESAQYLFFSEFQSILKFLAKYYY